MWPKLPKRDERCTELQGAAPGRLEGQPPRKPLANTAGLKMDCAGGSDEEPLHVVSLWRHGAARAPRGDTASSAVQEEKNEATGAPPSLRRGFEGAPPPLMHQSSNLSIKLRSKQQVEVHKISPEASSQWALPNRRHVTSTATVSRSRKLRDFRIK